MKTNSASFTLVEILVTTAMFSMLAAATMAVFSAGTRSNAKAKRYKLMIAEGQLALEKISADVRAATSREKSVISATDAENEGHLRNSIKFFIARNCPERKVSDEGGVSWVAYFINDDPSYAPLGLCRSEDRKLIQDQSNTKVNVIAPEINDLQFQFYDGLNWAGGWTSEQGCPKAVRIGLLVEDREHVENPLYFTTTVSVMAQ